MNIQHRITWTWLAQASRNSTVPFLYQTRTLSTICPYPLRLKSQQCHCYSTYDTYSKSPPSKPQPQTENGSASPLGLEFPDGSHSQADPAPTLEPRESYLRRRLSSKPRTGDMPHLATDSGTKGKSRKTTITAKEKNAFASLFSQLSPAEELSADEEARKEMEEISAIFDEVVQDVRYRQKQAENAEQIKDTAINVAKLQDATLPDTDEELAELLKSDQITLARAIELVAEREAAKIEAVLHTALGEGWSEAEIWKICKERIFSMMQLLDTNKKTAPVLPKLGLPDDHPDTTKVQNAATTDLLEVPACLPVEHVVVTLYPKTLLIAFRLLNLHFSGSPLIEHFRTTIKSLGRESAVLGASTGLYNELIYFYWRGCDDVPGVVSLVREMETTGVEPDSKTLVNLKAIARRRHEDQHRHRVLSSPDSEAEQWWNLPPNRRAMRELLGREGWIRRLEKRLKWIQQRKYEMRESEAEKISK